MIKWTDDLASGSEVIDQQHQELFRKINDFLACTDRDDSGKNLDRIIVFLQRYVNFHFETEETYMKLLNYKRSDIHKKQHQYFISKLQAIIDKLRLSGPSRLLASDAEDLLVDWFLNHIKTEDAMLGHAGDDTGKRKGRIA